MLLMSFAALAADPATIAVLGTVGGGILIRTAEAAIKQGKVVKNLSTPEERTEAMAMAILTDDSFSGCTLEFQRKFEQTLIDAGIPTELSKCYDERCETCHPPMDAKERMANRRLPGHSLPARTVETKTYDSCFRCKRRFDSMPTRQQKIYTRNEQAWCGHCINSSSIARIDRKKSLAAEKKRAAEAFDKSRAGKNRVANVSGYLVPIPPNVPKRAEAFIEYNSWGEMNICWSWTVDGEPNGKPMAFRQRTSPEMMEEFPRAMGTTITASRINATPVNSGDIWIDTGGTSTCEPCNEPTFGEVVTAMEYKLDELNKRNQELDLKMKMYKNSIINLNEMRKNL